MENRQDNFNSNLQIDTDNKTQTSNTVIINKIEEKIKNLKQNLRESYKKLKCSNAKEQETLNQNL
jgi:hypothetical protein